MKSKAPLALMEQLVMVLVFALAAALCLQVFAFAQNTSQHHGAQDRAVAEAQRAAETLKACAGDFGQAAERLEAQWEGGTLTLTLDDNWTPVAGGQAGAYQLTAREIDSGEALLGRAEVAVTTAQGDLLFSLPVAWQEVAP